MNFLSNDFIAGSFTSVGISSQGSGYLSGDICLLGYVSGGNAFHGTFTVHPVNGSLESISILNHGSNYSATNFTAELCFTGSTIIQVEIRSVALSLFLLLLIFQIADRSSNCLERL
jgi:hypothetical protein